VAAISIDLRLPQQLGNNPTLKAEALSISPRWETDSTSADVRKKIDRIVDVGGLLMDSFLLSPKRHPRQGSERASPFSNSRRDRIDAGRDNSWKPPLCYCKLTFCAATLSSFAFFDSTSTEKKASSVGRHSFHGSPKHRLIVTPFRYLTVQPTTTAKAVLFFISRFVFLDHFRHHPATDLVVDKRGFHQIGRWLYGLPRSVSANVAQGQQRYGSIARRRCCVFRTLC
jgi:hypothetical protein